MRQAARSTPTRSTWMKMLSARKRFCPPACCLIAQMVPWPPGPSQPGLRRWCISCCSSRTWCGALPATPPGKIVGTRLTQPPWICSTRSRRRPPPAAPCGKLCLRERCRLLRLTLPLPSPCSGWHWAAPPAPTPPPSQGQRLSGSTFLLLLPLQGRQHHLLLPHLL